MSLSYNIAKTQVTKSERVRTSFKSVPGSGRPVTVTLDENADAVQIVLEDDKEVSVKHRTEALDISNERINHVAIQIFWNETGVKTVGTNIVSEYPKGDKMTFTKGIFGTFEEHTHTFIAKIRKLKHGFSILIRK